MIWILPRLAGRVFDATLGQVVNALSGPGPSGRDTLRRRPEPFGGRPPGASPGTPAASSPAVGPPPVSTPPASPRAVPRAVAAPVRAGSDPSLAGDSIELVSYALVSVRPCEERVLPGGSGQVLVTTPMSGEAFTAWIVARYFQSVEYREAVARDPGNEIRHEEKRYLRVGWEVLHRWPKPADDCFDRGKVDALRDIRDAIRGLPWHPLRAAPSPTPESPKPEPPKPEPPKPAAADAERPAPEKAEAKTPKRKPARRRRKTPARAAPEPAPEPPAPGPAPPAPKKAAKKKTPKRKPARRRPSGRPRKGES